MPLTAEELYEADRIAALHSYHILDTVREKDFDELTKLASAICQTPISVINLIDEDRQWSKSGSGIEAGVAPRKHSFCAQTISSTTDIMIVPDISKDQRFANNPYIKGPSKVAFYAGVPLINEDGYALGSLCVLDHTKRELTDLQIQALKILAKQVMDKLELRRKMRILEKANQELLESNIFIQKFASMAAHDIKNPLSSMLLASQVLKNRVSKLNDEKCETLIDLNISSTRSLMTLVQEMQEYSKTPSLLLTRKQTVDLNSLLEKIIGIVNIPDNFEIQLPAENCEITLSIVAMEQIFINLLSNGIRYNSSEKGLIQIRFSQNEDYYQFEVEDNGIGIAEKYYQKIFSNNFTLKISDRYNNKGTGIGLSTVKDLIAALKGTIRVHSVIGKGTTFFLTVKK